MVNFNERWAIKYAPKQLSDCVFPQQTGLFFKNLSAGGYVPHIYLFGSPGTGKTTVTKVLTEVCNYDVLVINASLEICKDTLRDYVASYCSCFSLSGSPKALILDEADCMPKASQEALRGMMDKFQTNVSFVLTGNYPEKLIPAVKSRCVNLELGGLGNKATDDSLKDQIAARLRHICELENVVYDEAVVSRIIAKGFPNIRQIIIDVEMVLKFKAPLASAA